MSTVARNIGTTLEMIKIEHTLFALPFAFLGAVLAARGLPTLSQVLWITLAMVGARSTAMAFNRIADKDYDARNPRTKMRAIPAGALSVGFTFGIHDCGSRPLSFRRHDAESSDAAAGARCAGQHRALLVHQALDVAVASGSGLVPGNRPDGRMDRRAWLN